MIKLESNTVLPNHMLVDQSSNDSTTSTSQSDSRQTVIKQSPPRPDSQQTLTPNPISMVDLNNSLTDIDWLKARVESAAAAGGTSDTNGQVTDGVADTSTITDTSDRGKSDPVDLIRKISDGMMSSCSDAGEDGKASSVDSKKSSKADKKIVSFLPDGKPNLSYAELIKRAIETSENGRMTLNEIYQWVMDNFEYYRRQETGHRTASWKNSIRHNLSLNKSFVREQRDRGDPGKGSYWRIDEHTTGTNRQTGMSTARHRPNVVMPTVLSDNKQHALGHPKRMDAEKPRINPAVQRMFPDMTSANSQHSPFGSDQSSNDGYWNTSWNSPEMDSSNTPVIEATESAELESDNTQETWPDSSIGAPSWPVNATTLNESMEILYRQVLNSSLTQCFPNAMQQQPVTTVTLPTHPTIQSTETALFSAPPQRPPPHNPASSCDWMPLVTSATDTPSIPSGAALDSSLIHNINMEQFQRMVANTDAETQRTFRDMLATSTGGDLASSWYNFTRSSSLRQSDASTNSGGSVAAPVGDLQTCNFQLLEAWINKPSSQNNVTVPSADADTPPALDSQPTETRNPVLPVRQETPMDTSCCADTTNQAIITDDEIGINDFDWDSLI